MGLIHGDRSKLREEEPRVEEQTMKVAALEDDGVVTTTYNSISNTLYDLADANSKTTRVVLPQGTTISLAATSKPGLGSYRATFEVAAKEGMPQTAYGTQAATDLAFKLDLLQLPEKDRKKLLRLSEEELIEEARRHLPAPLQEKSVKVSGYVTKNGRHVGAYLQIRKVIGKISDGGAAHFPDGITVKQSGGKYEVYGGGGPGDEGATGLDSVDKAALVVSGRSAYSKHPRSIGGTSSYDLNVPTANVNSIPADNPKLPGTPHPDHVADRAAKARKAAKLPSRKERAENERKAKERRETPSANDQRKAAGKEGPGNRNDDLATVTTGSGGKEKGHKIPPPPPGFIKGGGGGGKPKSGDYGAMSEKELRGITDQPERMGGASPEQRKAAAAELDRRDKKRGGNFSHASNPPKRRSPGGGGGMGWSPDDPPEKQARDMTAGTNETSPEDWKSAFEELTKKNRSLKVDGLRAAWAHATSTGQKKLAERIMRSIKIANGRSSKSSRLVEEAPEPSGGGFIRG